MTNWECVNSLRTRPFRFVAVPVCGRFGLWPFRSVAVSACGRSGLWPFRFVAVSVCGRFGLWPFRLWPFRFVAVMTCYRRSDRGPVLVGRIDHGGGCSIWQSGRMIQYWARRARNQGDLSSSMLRGESITYGMLQEIRLLDLHIKTKNAFCKYSGLQHRLQHSFKCTATTASEQHPLLGYVQGDGETV